jgi:activator of HSP90 ATPase
MAWNMYISGKNIELVKDKKIVQEWKTTEWPKATNRQSSHCP